LIARSISRVIKEFSARRTEAKRRGKLRGIGVSCFLEHSGAMPVEGAAFVFREDNILELRLNVHSTGQSHATVFGRLVAKKFGIRPDEITHRHGDSDFGLAGYASVGSRSAMAAGHSIAKASTRSSPRASVSPRSCSKPTRSQIDYRDGAFEMTGTNRRVPLFDLARNAGDLVARGVIEEGLDTIVKTETPQTFPNGCHIAEVEIDPETGKIVVAAYTAVDDCGNVLDHTIVEAQVQGGVVQGLGQALLEHTVYDRETAQLLTASFMDYAMPRADEVPDVIGDVHPVPATTNPLGTKGVGEAGTTASLAAFMNAIADAIPGPAGATIDMPATLEKVWRACRESAEGRARFSDTRLDLAEIKASRACARSPTEFCSSRCLATAIVSSIVCPSHWMRRANRPRIESDRSRSRRCSIAAQDRRRSRWSSRKNAS
jgi:aerobic carbon-monoxide dehydrogenase large subunit